MINQIKEAEMQFRINAWPQKNNPPLPFDEIRELWNYTKDNGLDFADDNEHFDEILP
jgi:hypothetical protein